MFTESIKKSLPVEWSCQGSWIGYGPYYGTATFGQPQYLESPENFEPDDITVNCNYNSQM